MTDNPLRSFFRQPELYLNLPSNGKYWPDGSVIIPVSGELPIYSMTAGDEIFMMTPDALFNGEATVKLIQNCVPNIRDAWQTPSVDLESILIAIRIASVGEKLSIEVACPKCKESRDYDVDLKTLISEYDPSIWTQQLSIGTLTFSFRPLNYYELTHINQKIFQNRKQIQQITDIQDLDQQEEVTNRVLTDFNQLDLDFLITSVSVIQTQDQQVTNPVYIREFIMNSDKKTYSKIKTHVEKLKDSTRCGSVNIACNECNHEFFTEISLDYTSFFAQSS